ncbi:MAG: autotransporter outer membrane beta-barrel domain-containing protein, partial [Planctomycetota bacterium]
SEADDLTELDLDAGGGSIILNAGAITDSDGDVDLSASLADVTASSFGDGTDSINTAVADLTIDTSGSNGDQYIIETGGLTALNLSAGSGSIILSAGAITDTDGDTDIMADVLDLTAGDGIGGTQAIETEAKTISAETTNNGANIDIDNVNAVAANVEITKLKTSGGTINFDQTGGAVLNIASGGSGVDSGNGGSVNGGDITINGADGIVVDRAITSASGNGGALNIGGGVEINAGVTTGAGSINLNRSAGFGGGDIIVSSQLNSSGNMDLTTSTGGVQVTTTGRIDAGGEVGLYGSNLNINPGVAVEIQSGGSDVMVEAGGNISIEDVDYDPWAPSGEDIIISGPITSTGGGVRIIGGAIYTGAGGELDVPITGYSDSSSGVSFPYSNRGRAAIVMWSLLEDLMLGTNAVLTANGASSPGVDERGDIFSDRFGPNAGDPIDVGIYLWCFNLSNLVNPQHVLTVNSNSISSSTSAVVFDAGNSIYFGTDFENYLAGTPEISRIEVVSRIASSLNHVTGAGTPDLPHAGEDKVFWNLMEGPDKGYVLRGDFWSNWGSIVGRAFVLDFIDPIPLVSFALEPPELELEEVESLDLDELLGWLLSEFGEDAKTYFVGAYNDEYFTDMIPIKSALRLRELSRILGDYETYVAALTQVVNEFASPETPMAPEQLDAANQLIALHFNADDGTHYAAAGQWLGAITEYFNILTNTETGEYTEIGMAPQTSLGHIMTRYIGPAQRDADESVVEYIDTHIELLGS